MGLLLSQFEGAKSSRPTCRNYVNSGSIRVFTLTAIGTRVCLHLPSRLLMLHTLQAFASQEETSGMRSQMSDVLEVKLLSLRSHISSSPTPSHTARTLSYSSPLVLRVHQCINDSSVDCNGRVAGRIGIRPLVSPSAQTRLKNLRRHLRTTLW